MTCSKQTAPLPNGEKAPKSNISKKPVMPMWSALFRTQTCALSIYAKLITCPKVIQPDCPIYRERAQKVLHCSCCKLNTDFFRSHKINFLFNESILHNPVDRYQLISQRLPSVLNPLTYFNMLLVKLEPCVRKPEVTNVGNVTGRRESLRIADCFGDLLVDGYLRQAEKRFRWRIR